MDALSTGSNKRLWFKQMVPISGPVYKHRKGHLQVGILLRGTPHDGVNPFYSIFLASMMTLML